MKKSIIIPCYNEINNIAKVIDKVLSKIEEGDNIIIVNSEKVLLKGQKRQNKQYYWHTGYPGGIKSTTPEKILTSKTPSKVIQLAVKRMIPKGPLGRKVLKQLHVYSGNVHPYEAQKPELIDIKALNRKNS